MEALGALALKIYMDYGLILTLIIFLVAAALYDIMRCGSRYLRALMSHMLFSRRKARLVNHVLFHKLDTLLKYRIGNMNINCLLRNKLFTDLLIIKVTAVKTVLADFATADVDGLSAADFRQAVADRLSAIAFMWSSTALKDGIPAIAVEKFKIQNDIWGHVLDLVMLDQCLVTTTYQTNSERLDTIFDMIGSFEIHCFSDVEKVVAHLNGEISACTYKGLTCNNCSPDCNFKAAKFKHNAMEDDK